MIRKKLFSYILISISLTSLATGLIIYFTAASILNRVERRNREDTTRIIQMNLMTFRTILALEQQGIVSSETPKLIAASGDLLAASHPGTLAPERMRRIADRYGLDELYIIDTDNIITASTVPSDIGLDLKKSRYSIDSFLTSVRGSGEAKSHTITPSTMSGKINCYVYYSPPGSRYILESSVNVTTYMKRRYGFDNYHNLAESFFRRPFMGQYAISDIDIFAEGSLASWSILRESQADTAVSPKTLGGKRSHEIRRNSRLISYQRIEIQEPEHFSPVYYARITYDTTSRMRGISIALFILLLIIPLFALGNALLLNRVLEREFTGRIITMSSELEELGRRERTGISATGTDELSAIAGRINSMYTAVLAREGELEYFKEYFRNVINSMPSMIFTLDANGRIEQINTACLSFFRIRLADVMLASEAIPVYAKLAHSIAAVQQGEHRAVAELDHMISGKRHYLTAEIFPMGAFPTDRIIIRLEDVTEKKERERELAQAQKMELVGILAGGFAHNLNNVLSGITGSISLIKYKLTRRNTDIIPAITDNLDTIVTAAERAADMTKQMLTLSTAKEVDHQPVDLAAAISRVSGICRNTFDSTVSITTSVATSPAVTVSDPAEIDHLLLNLAVNAYQAMTVMRDDSRNRGGHLSIELTDDCACWKISVCDTGVGIPDEHREHIFDPFFTTKAKGSGLGLVMAYNTVSRSGGSIRLEATGPNGSVFSVRLPKSDGTAHQSVCAHSGVEDGSGMVLLVDDEPLVRKTARAILESFGFSVIEAESGSTALEAAEHCRIDMAIIDYIMPGMNGKEVFTELAKRHPGLMALLSSGYLAEGSLTEIMHAGFAGYLKKPYSAEELISAVNRILRSHP